MSKGNQKTSGGKGKNMPFQFNNLLALAEIKNAITGIGNPPSQSGLASEATLLAVQTAVENMRDYEVRLVEDSDSPAVTWLEVRYWDAQSGALGAPQYYLPGSSTPGTPTGGITYINAQTLLTQILSEITSLDGKFNSLGQKASAASTPMVLSTEQEAIFTAIKVAVESVLEVNLDADADQVGLWGYYGTTNATVIRLKATDEGDGTGYLKTENSKPKTATSIDTSADGATGSVPIGATEVSFFNNGAADATVNGKPLPAGVTRTFGFRNPLAAAIAYNSNGEQLLIDYMA